MNSHGDVVRKSWGRSRLAAGAIAVLLGLGVAMAGAQSASAEATCTSFSREGGGGNYLSGSCKGTSSSGAFTVKWQCGKWDTVRSKSFGGGGFGASFKFKACDRYVYSAWVV